MDGSMFNGIGAAFLFLLGVIAVLAVAAFASWSAAGWTALGLVAAAFIRYAGR